MTRYNHAHIAAQLFNTPHMVEPSYGQVFVSALAPRLNIQSLTLGDGTELHQPDMIATAESYMRGQRKLYHEMDGIAIIPVDGTLVHDKFGGLNPESGMTNYSSIQMKAEAAAADPDVLGIVLDINSPGGSAAGVFNLSQQLAEIAQTKPIWAVVDELACSAAYALASACTKIVAPENAMLGSIGVVMMHVDQSEMIKGMGLNVTYIFSGDHKIDGNSFEPIPSAVQAGFQKGVDDARDRFVQLVATNRGMDPQAVYDTQAQVYDARDALDVGLLDEIMRTDKVLEAFSASLRASTPARFGATLKNGAKAMALPLWGRNKASNKAAAAERKEPTLDAGAEGQHKLHVDANGVIGGFSVASGGEPVLAWNCASWPAERVEALEAAGFTINRDTDGNAESVVLPQGEASATLRPADDAEKQAAGTGEQMTEINAGEAETVETLSIKGGRPAPASLDALVSLCSEHQCDTLAKPLRDRGVTAEQAEAIMADVDAIRDKMAVTFPDDPKAAADMANRFAVAAHGSATAQFAEPLSALMVEAQARMAGEEIDQHPPETSQAAGQGRISARAVHKRHNTRK
ncbi:S49 family peptidase [Salinisphaera sp. T31B1]|uniref:S49 family peptidase n=1 Tax=Salinisphaera sp. T31B1 TaxID=727963 RepID=UPI0033411A42